MKALPIAAAIVLAAAAAAEMPLIQPSDLAARIAGKNTRPVVIHVGPNVLYRSKHVPGALYAGPASKTEGLDALKAAVAKLPKERAIVIYCGCCPWDRCPNVKPALDLLRNLGFTHAKAMYLAENFKTNWIDLGYPTEQ